MANLSQLEILLTKPFRKLLKRLKYHGQHQDTPVLKRYAFIISLASCLSNGSIVLFSVWTPFFQDILGYSQTDINIISGVSSIGMYLLLPIIGNLSDVYGTALVALLSIVNLCLGYLMTIYVFHNKLSHYVMACSFFMIGFGTSCLYFTSMLNCANLYPNFKGLSISLPVTCYGLSSLLLSRILKWMQFDLIDIFKFFIYVYLTMGLLSYSSSCILTYLKIQKNKDAILLEASVNSLQYDNYGGVSSDVEQIEENDDEILDEIDSITEIDHNIRFKKILKSSKLYFFLISFFLCIGPLEMYVNNIGSLTTFLHYSTISNQISTHAIFSTITRLLIGLIVDYFEAFSISTSYILFAVITIGVLDQILLVFTINGNPNFLTLSSSLSGLTYGGIFTVFPNMILELWGIELLGSIWGFFMIAPAFSSLLFGLVYAFWYDCHNDYFSVVFILTATSLFGSLMFAFFTWRIK